MIDPGSLNAHAETAPLAGYCILVVDDDEDIRTYLLTVFADAGAQVCEAADGAEAIAVARVRRPDLITLDLSMPGTDGIDAFCQLRQTPELEELPVCIITGHPEFRSLIYDRPTRPPEGFLGKPISERDAVQAARRILALGLRRRERRA